MQIVTTVSKATQRLPPEEVKQRTVSQRIEDALKVLGLMKESLRLLPGHLAESVHIVT